MILTKELFDTYINHNISESTLQQKRHTPYTICSLERGDNSLSKLGDLTENIQKFFENIFGWVTCNPSKKSIREFSEKMFVYYNENASDLLNSKLGMLNFFNDLKDNNGVQKIFIKGYKGSGKTYTVNYFLNKYTKELAEKYSIVWLRIDMSKVYDHYSKSNPNIFSYYYAQIIYVFSRYHKEMSDSIDADCLMKLISHRELVEALKSQNINIGTFQKVYNTCRQINHHGEIKNKPLDYDDAEEVSKIILRLLYEKGIRIVLFFDGIDNIDYALNNNYFTSVLEQVNSLIHSVSVNHNKIIVSCRPETISMMNGINYNYNFEKEYQVLPTNPKDILDNGIRLIKDQSIDQPEYFKKIFSNYIVDIKEKTKIFDEYTQFPEIAKYLIDDLVIYINNFDVRLSEITKSKNILEDIFAGSIREYLHSLISSYSYVRTYAQQKGFVDKSSNFLIKDDFWNTRVQQRLNILLEGVFLDGRIYYKEHAPSDLPNFQKNSMNLFRPIVYNHRHSNPANNKVLPYTTVLLPHFILCFLQEGIKDNNDLIQEMTTNLGFDENIIKVIYKKLLEYRYIIEQKVDDDIIIKVTQKGAFLSKFIFKNSRILYIYSIDTEFPQHYFSNNHLTAHARNANDLWYKYPSSVLKNVPTLMHYLNSVLKYTRNKYNDTKIFDKRYKIEFNLDQIYKELFDLRTDLDGDIEKQLVESMQIH